MRHVISVDVENKFGVLARISGLFSSRGYNIDSLSVGETVDPAISRMTIVVRGDDRVLEQVTKQLNRLIDVIKVVDLPGGTYVERELILIKLSVTSATRSQVVEIVNIFRAKIVDISQDSMTVEVTGTGEKIEAMLNILRPFGLKEVARTGKVAMPREMNKNGKNSR